ncbi:HNH endonuclease [Leisingera caerulea]|uniref:HNH endonuclease n=1 Tax=Leisingera caerulea TaxID=506591 RepID=UPI0021A471F8|nr:HNH endonuclease signature motif containing protein [Leisingera caerulea]UWQ48968.1 HNH endonuclease [Leisingera caerulea]
MDLAIAGKCPYCGANFVTDVDHFLPVSKFFKFSALTYNLVPSCHPCNKKKLSKYGDCVERSFFHPYFDRMDGVTWAFCEVGLSGRLRIEYKADPTACAELNVRVNHFLREIGVARTWKVHASHFLITKRSRFVSIFERKGTKGLRLYLESCFEDAVEEEISKNNWKTSLVSALLKTPEFFTIEGLSCIPEKKSLL